MESVDANVLLRLVLGDVPEQHALARDLLTRPGRPVTATPVVLMELAHALTSHYGLSREVTADALKGLLDLDNLDVDRPPLDAALDGWVAHPKLSLEDCYAAALAVATGAAPLWTFDKKLARQHPGARELTATALGPGLAAAVSDTGAPVSAGSRKEDVRDL